MQLDQYNIMTKPKSAPRALNEVEIPHEMKYVEGWDGNGRGDFKNFSPRMQDTFTATTVVTIHVSSCFL